MNARLSIGFVARQAGCTVPTIRYYEDIGLLQPADRTEAGQRQFDEGTIRRLAFIRRCRDFGFSIDQVRELVGLVDEPDRPCAEVRDIAALHLFEVRRKLDELKALEASLCAFVCSCESACVGGPAVDCTILENLAIPADQAQRARQGGDGCCAS
ncbi:MAG: helix-turn-helix domain-containing protein [Hydrogenophaga sp.]|uniref:MerR family transcriptional regulator n=1 Tax=Hydrogenophaga sp. TaxID=1904254 RepID=UPI0025BBF621|nr:helix-turn-helix domain-containing protein [Hydrogenophaga sp.]MBT9552684.1 helix-turn-helix domain-containing protein [Hydrogenophaga sp.]